MYALQAGIIILSVIALALLLNTISHAWVSSNITVRQKGLFVFPLCIVCGYLFAALVLALLRPELLLPEVLRTTTVAWMYLSGVVMLLVGIYYVAFATEVAVAHQLIVEHGHRWAHWFLPVRPHPSGFRFIAIILTVGGLFLCSNAHTLALSLL